MTGEIGQKEKPRLLRIPSSHSWVAARSSLAFDDETAVAVSAELAAAGE